MTWLFNCILISWIFLGGIADLYSQLIFFPSDAAKFISNNIDSVFIFTNDLAVTASGDNITNIFFKNNIIYGENVPPTLNLRGPMGAILYQQGFDRKIPVIISRRNEMMPQDQLIRKYLLGMSRFNGRSEKGGIQINVWQKKATQIPYLIFLKNGKILGNNFDDDTPQSKNCLNFQIKDWPAIENDIAGVWIYPPETGINQVSAKILRLLKSGPLLIEFWDGLGWQYFEKGCLSRIVLGKIGSASMGYVLYPPETATNYSAMVSGGLPNIIGKKNIFHGLDELKVDYLVLEGEKLIFPIPGNLQLHHGKSPEDKDTKIYQSALTAIENSPPPLLFLHYHGLDDLSHSVGPYDKRTIEHLKRLWIWHRKLRKQWTGNILIISDHGAHPVENDEQLNKKFIDKGTKGTHGDFIFDDMAVPIIEVEGKGQKSTAFKLTTAQAHDIWNLLGQPISAENNGNIIMAGTLQIIINSDTLIFNSEKDSDLFGQNFYFNYLKKGSQLNGQFNGSRLSTLLKNYDLLKIKQIVVYSFDGQQIVYSIDDMIHNMLVIELKRSPETSAATFTLYPLKDKFPNRIMKQLKMIEIF